MNLATRERAVPAVETFGLTKRYGATVALSGCTIAVPQGSICALVGPNGAGKTTLLRLLAGLSRPSGGRVEVFGQQPAQDPGFLTDVGFLAQEIPLWRRFSAADHLDVGAHLNTRWDRDGAEDRLRQLSIPLDRPVGNLSGGQRAQVALGLALAKQPRLLLLDEPVAALDPLARRHFLSMLTEAVAGWDLTVVISSHLIGDLERVCDHLVLLSASRPQLCGGIDQLMAAHKVLTGSRRVVTGSVEGTHAVIDAHHTPRQTTLVVRGEGPVLDPDWDVSEIGLEELILAYMAQDGPPGVGDQLNAVGGQR
ncbi:MAG TPA: ABC transporter ATP-binding protein [Acidimicrobiales bacterium]|nr:ABC transporter ATP-binding protein [Acidimicrobiales bacterium]